MYSQCDQHYILNIWMKVFLNLHLNIDGLVFYCFIAHGWKPIANIWWELYEAFDSHSQSINPIDSCSACIYAMTLQWRHYDHGGVSNHQPRVVYSTVYSDADQRKHQSSASLAFVWGIHRDRWIPRTKGQLRGKCFHLMTSSWIAMLSVSQTPQDHF